MSLAGLIDELNNGVFDGSDYSDEKEDELLDNKLTYEAPYFFKK